MAAIPPTTSSPTSSPLTPVTLLTGFLGSGKTTLLNRLLASPALHDTAVLINEYGATPIDHLLVRSSSDNITVLANGCVCCSVAGDMVNALRDLYFKRSQGVIPAFRRVVIETTGLADPAPILHTLLEMPLVVARYVLSGIVTTVDATHALAQLETHAESAKQAAVADRLVITKCDLASAETIHALRSCLAKLNPGATLIEAAHGEVDPDIIFDTGLHHPGKWLNAGAYRPLLPKNTTAAPRHDERIAAFCVRYEQPVVWDELINALEILQSVRADNLLRIKGIVNVAGEPRPWVIHAVQHTLYPAATLAAWPDNDHSTRLVFIVRDIDPAFIQATLDDCFSTAPTFVSA